MIVGGTLWFYRSRLTPHTFTTNPNPFTTAPPPSHRLQDVHLLAQAAPPPPLSPTTPTDGDATTPPSSSTAARLLPPAPGRIVAVFTRALDTCDEDDMKIRPGLPQHVVWSHGRAWPVYHGEGSRGATGKGAHCNTVCERARVCTRAHVRVQPKEYSRAVNCAVLI